MTQTPPLNMYQGERQYQQFAHMDDLFPVARMAPSSAPRPFPAGAPLTLPDTYVFEGETRAVDAFLTSTDTAALFVLQDGQVRL